MANRKHAPHAAENRVWKAGYAWSSFQAVTDICEYILNTPIQPDDKMYYPLITAISVLYSRPFKRSKGIESLTVQFVPKKFLDLHDQLILVRDQTTAHVDARSPLLGELPANNVRLLMRGNKVALGVTRASFNRTAILRIHELTGTLVQRMLDYIRKVASQYPNEVPDGDYLIDLTTKTLRRCD